MRRQQKAMAKAITRAVPFPVGRPIEDLSAAEFDGLARSLEEWGRSCDDPNTGGPDARALVWAGLAVVWRGLGIALDAKWNHANHPANRRAEPDARVRVVLVGTRLHLTAELGPLDVAGCEAARKGGAA